MRSLWIFFLLFFTTFLISEEIDLGEIKITDQYESTIEKQDEPSTFTTVINVNEKEHKTLGEVLKNSGSIIILSTGGESGIAAVSIRGSSSKQVLIMIDGVPISSAGDDSVDLNLIPTSSIEKIEIIRGGNSSLYGSYAMGGVVNIITKNKKNNSRKISFFFKPRRKIGGFYNHSVNTDKVSLNTSINFLYDVGNFYFYNNNETTFNKMDDFIDEKKNNDLIKQGFLLNLSFFYPEQMKLSFKINEYIKANGVSGPINFPLEDARIQNMLTFGNISYDFGNLNKFFTASIFLYYKLNWIKYEDTNTSTNNNITNAWGMRTRFSILSIPFHILSFEASLSGEYLDNKAYEISPWRLNFSFIIKDEFLILDEKIGILPSLRIDYSNDYNTEVSGKIGFFYAPVKEFKLKINTFTSYRNPNFSELYYTYGFIEGNPDLIPEHGYGGDLGCFFDLYGFFIEGVGFINYYRDLIHYILSHGYIYKTLNIGDSLSFGAEVRFGFQPLDFFKIEMNYTLNYLIEVGPDTQNYFIQLPFQPMHVYNYLIEFLPKYFVIGFSSHIESRKHITRTGSKYIPPYCMLNTYLRIILTGKKVNYSSEFFIEFNNLTNVYTYDHRNFPLEGFNIESGFSFIF